MSPIAAEIGGVYRRVADPGWRAPTPSAPWGRGLCSSSRRQASARWARAVGRGESTQRTPNGVESDMAEESALPA